MSANLLFYPSLLLLFFISCTYTQKIRDGHMAYDRMQYSVAADMLGKEYKKTKSRIEKGKIAFKLGESYRRMNQIEKATNWYLAAYDSGYGVDALKAYAFALKRSEQYEEAQEAFKNLGIEIGSPYEYRREITACKQAADWQKEAENSGFEVSLADFNSPDADYAPTLYRDGQLLFTSDRSTASGDELYNWTGQHFSDLFLVNEQEQSVSPFDAVINTPNNEGTATFNQDFTEMYFTRCFNDEKLADKYCKLMQSSYTDGAWSEAEVLNFVEEKVNYGHPSLSKDGSTLYFSAEHPDGWGGYDIYSTERSPDGWDPPRLLSRSINSLGHEKFPYIDADTLYFASDHHTGMGGLDIFRSFKMGNGKWSPAHNLKPPINSGGDDFGFVIEQRNIDQELLQSGYFSSTRLNGKGNDDIYRYQKRKPPPMPDTVEPDPEPIVYKLLLDGYVLEKIYQDPGNPNSKVLGRKPLASSKVAISFGEKKREVTVGDDGLFSLELEEQTDYAFLASHPGYLNNSATFSSKGIGKDPNNPVMTYEVEIVLDKIFVDKEITLDNIYYDFDKWDIRTDAQPTLNQLATTLKQNPEIRIQLASHTDCRGNARYNETLSQRRAQSVVDYLIANGIAADRLVAKGFGKGAPAVHCACSRCSEEEHQANRRTTFKILQ